MDSLRGKCWVCNLNADRSCPKCNLSCYCSLDCQKKDRVRHFEECIGATKARQLCSLCGKQSSSESFCWICCAVCYCSSSCQKNHELTHKELCGNVKERELHFTLLDASPHLLSRNILLLYLLRKSLEREKDTKQWITRVLFIYYSLRLDAGSFAFLCVSLEGLQSMTFSRFMLETQNTIKLSRGTFNKIRRIWRGWLEFSSDHEALNKMESVRNCKISCVEVQQIMEKVRRLLPRGHEVGFLQWLNHGSFILEESGGTHANVTLGSFNPHVEDYLCIYPDIQLDVSMESGQIKSVVDKDLMIYSPYATDMIFQDWDYHDVIHNTSLGDGAENLLDIYQSFIEKVLYKAGKNLISGDIKVRFIMTELPDNNVETFLPVEASGSYDRICTGLYADIIGLPKLLTTIEPYLNKLNPFSRLFTHHRLWSTFIEEKNITVLKKEWIINNTLEKLIDPATLVGTKWATFRQFLQAELFCYRNKIDDIKIVIDKIPNFNEITDFIGLEMVDFLAELNGVFPFRFRSDKRYVTMTDNKLYTLEWKKKQHQKLQSSKFSGGSITPGEISKQIPEITGIKLLNLSKKDSNSSTTNVNVTKVRKAKELTSPTEQLSSFLKSNVRSSAESSSKADVSHRSLFWQKPCENDKNQDPNPRVKYFRRKASFEYAELLSKRKKLDSQDRLNSEFRYSERQKFKENRSFSISVERGWNSSANGDNYNELAFSATDGNICGDRSNNIFQTRQKGTVKDLISLFSKDKMDDANLLAPLSGIQIEKFSKIQKETIKKAPRKRSVFRLSGDENSFWNKSTTDQNNKIRDQTVENFPFGKRNSNASRGKMEIKIDPSSSIKIELNDITNTTETATPVQEISKELAENNVRPIVLLTQDRDIKKQDPTQSPSSVKDIITVFESSAVEVEQQRQQKSLEQEVHLEKSVSDSHEQPASSQVGREAASYDKHIDSSEDVKKAVNPVVRCKQEYQSVDNFNTEGQSGDKAKDVPDMNSKIVSPDKSIDKVTQSNKKTVLGKATKVKNSVISNITKIGRVNLYRITHVPGKGQYRRKSVDENVLKDLEKKTVMTKSETLLNKESIEHLESESKKSRKNKTEEEVRGNYKKQGRSKSEGDLPMLNAFTDTGYKFDCKVHFKRPEVDAHKNEQKNFFSKFQSCERKIFYRGGKKTITNKNMCTKQIVTDTKKSSFSPNSETTSVENTYNETDKCSIKIIQPEITETITASQSEETIKLFELKVREDMTKYKSYYTQADEKNSEANTDPKNDFKNTSSEHKLICLKKNEELERNNEKKYSIYTMSIKPTEKIMSPRNDLKSCIDHRSSVKNSQVSDQARSIHSSPDIDEVVAQDIKLTNMIAKLKPTPNDKGLHVLSSTRNSQNNEMYFLPENVKQHCVAKTSCSDLTFQNPKCFVSKITWNPHLTEKEAKDNGELVAPKKKLSFKHLLFDHHGDIYCSGDGNYIESPPYRFSDDKEFSYSKKEIINRKKLMNVFDEDKEHHLDERKAVDVRSVYDTANDSVIDGVEEAVDAASLIGFGTPQKFKPSGLRKLEKETAKHPKKEQYSLFIADDGKKDFPATCSGNFQLKNVLLENEFKIEEGGYQSENPNVTNSSYFKSIFGAKSFLPSPLKLTKNIPETYVMKEIKSNLVTPFANVDQRRSTEQNTPRQMCSPASFTPAYQFEQDQGKVQETIHPHGECSSPTIAVQSVLKSEGNRCPFKKRLRVSWGDLPHEGVNYLSENEEDGSDLEKKRSKGLNMSEDRMISTEDKELDTSVSIRNFKSTSL